MGSTTRACNFMCLDEDKELYLEPKHPPINTPMFKAKLKHSRQLS